MKRTTAIVLILMSVGCSRVPSDVEAKINAIAKSPGHPWTQWVADVDALLADIKGLPDNELKIKCLQRFTDRMMEVDLMDSSFCDVKTAADGMIDECVYRIPGIMNHLADASIEEVWDVRLKMLAWMQTQAKRLYGDGTLPKGMQRHKNGALIILDHAAYRLWADRRNAYRALTAAYNERLNYAEKNFPNPLDGKIDERRIPELKKKIEKFLGRPMRTPEQCDEDWYNEKREFPKW